MVCQSFCSSGIVEVVRLCIAFFLLSCISVLILDGWVEVDTTRLSVKDVSTNGFGVCIACIHFSFFNNSARCFLASITCFTSEETCKSALSSPHPRRFFSRARSLFA
jgi:hypothetical protein